MSGYCIEQEVNRLVAENDILIYQLEKSEETIKRINLELIDKLVNDSCNITISLGQVEDYIKTLSGEYDEWWMPEYDLYGIGLISFLQDVDRGFGDSAGVLLKLHAIEADRLEKERKAEQRVADDAYRAIGEAPTKTEGKGYEY